MRIQQLEIAETIHYFWKLPKLKFEKLEGEEDLFSVRLDKKWRLEFNIDFEDEDKTIGTIFIKELSKHYE